MLEIITAMVALAIFDFKRCYAVIAAQLYVLSHVRSIFWNRSFVKNLRTVADIELVNPMFFGSIVWLYFGGRRRRVSEFLKVQQL